jgi:hypothetical protein
MSNMSRSAERLMLRNNAKELAGGAKKAWSQAGPLFCQQLHPVVTMNVCFPEPDVYTVQFEISSLLQDPGQSAQLTFADIVWSVNGTNVKRTVSVISGTTVSGVGEAVYVKVYDASPPGSEVGVAGAKYTATINISPGLRPAQSQQPYYDIPNPNSGLSGFFGKCAFPVPGGAPGSVQVFFPQAEVFYISPPTTTGLPIPIGATSIHVSVGSLDGSPIADNEAQVRLDNIGRVYDPRNSPQWQPLPPGAYAATLLNWNPTVEYIFSVTLGIDG